MNAPRLLTVEEVCGILRVSRWTLDRKRKSGELVPVRLGPRFLRYRQFDVERYMDRLRPAK